MHVNSNVGRRVKTNWLLFLVGTLFIMIMFSSHSQTESLDGNEEERRTVEVCDQFNEEVCRVCERVSKGECGRCAVEPTYADRRWRGALPTIIFQSQRTASHAS